MSKFGQTKLRPTRCSQLTWIDCCVSTKSAKGGLVSVLGGECLKVLQGGHGQSLDNFGLIEVGGSHS